MTPQLLLACAACLGMSDRDIENRCFERFGHGTGFRSHEEEDAFVEVLDEIGRPSKWRNQGGVRAGAAVRAPQSADALVATEAAATSLALSMEDARFYRRPAP